MKGATMPAENGLSESLENYLETILYLEQSQKVARAKDIADRLNVQRGSVTGALKNLSEKGYINYEPYSFITLTSEGMKLGMEHAIDKKTFERLVCFIDYVFTCPRAGEEWIQSFANYCASGGRKQAECDLCIQSIQTGK
jgi:DtxR family transcriptional regulator, Mn-dependent transcriptional regulator